MSETIGTTCVQGGYRPGDGEPRQVPIYQSTTWKYDTSEHMGRLFDLEESGYFYTRLAEPHERCRGREDRRAGGRHGSHAHVVGPGGQLLRRVQHRGLRRPRGGQLRHLRRHVQPAGHTP